MPADSGVTAHHLVAFRLGRRQFALHLDRVERVLRMVAVTAVPGAPRWLAGMINCHGQVIPVADLRPQMGNAPRPLALDDRLLLVRVGDRTVALVVDEVTGMLDTPTDPLGLPPELASCSPLLEGVLARDEGLILVVDADHLLPSGSEVAEERLPGALWDFPTEVPGLGNAAADGTVKGIKGIGPVYARKLAEAGIRSVAALAKANVDQVIELLGLSPGRKRTAQGWLEQAVRLAQCEPAAPQGSEMHAQLGAGHTRGTIECT